MAFSFFPAMVHLSTGLAYMPNTTDKRDNGPP
jgi:hypothetical protein